MHKLTDKTLEKVLKDLLLFDIPKFLKNEGYKRYQLVWTFHDSTLAIYIRVKDRSVLQFVMQKLLDELHDQIESIPMRLVMRKLKLFQGIFKKTIVKDVSWEG